MDTHQTTKECLIRNFREQMGNDEVFQVINYQSLFNIATSMISDLFEIETARKMFSDIYESLMKNEPGKMDWFIRKIWKNNFDYKFDNSEFDKLLMAIDIVKKYGINVIVSKTYFDEDRKIIITKVVYAPKRSEFTFYSFIDHEEMLTAVSEYKDVALLDTCDFGIPEHREIPVKYDIANMSLNEICQAYLNMGGQPIIIEP